VLGPRGIWARELRFGDPVEAVEAAAELEDLGFSALWIPGGGGGDVLDCVETMLRATTTATVATGILNIWGHDAADVAATEARLRARHGERFLLGLGVGHARLVDADAPGRYARPVVAMAAYLDALDAFATTGAPPVRVVAALAPRMVELARRRTSGVHPYMTTIEHTRWVRGELGSDAIVAPALGVVLEPDPRRARSAARQDLALYLTLPNYVRTWLRLGFTEDDLAGGGTDRLVDALYAHGTAEQVAARVGEHREAGASHVCLRVVTNQLERLPRAEWRTLGAALATERD
jgi:probable F420-dependent oxidoreductase